MSNNLVYGIHDKPKFDKLIVFAFQQLLAIIAATIAVPAILISFISPFVAFLDSIPGCVMGGVCITLYGFIAVSGLKMIQKVDLEDHANLFTVSVILITGIGGMAMAIGKIYITCTACALVLGILVNILLNSKTLKKLTSKDENEDEK